MIGTGWTPAIEPSFVQEDAAVGKKLPTGARPAGTFLLVGSSLDPANRVFGERQKIVTALQRLVEPIEAHFGN